MKAKPLGIGIASGLFLALLHACWAALVALGWAQPVMNFVFWAHFISPPWHMEAFAWQRACILIGITFAAGLALGTAGGWFWNRFAATDR